MSLKKSNEKVTFDVNTPYGKISVQFIILEVLNETDYIYLAYAQKRIAIIQNKVDGWYLVKDKDLISFTAL